MKDTKEVILKTAYTMFLYNNYEAVTFNKIISATGLTKGAIYHYYSSKEELFKAVVDKYMLENCIDGTVEFPSLEALIHSTIAQTKARIAGMEEDNPNYSNEIPINYLSLLVAAYRYYPGYVNIGTTFFNGVKEKWYKTLTQAVENKEIRSDIDIEAQVANFVQIGSSIVSNMMTGGTVAKALELLERQYREMYRSIKC